MCDRIASINRSIRCGHDVRGEYTVIEPDICHAKNVSLEAGFDSGGKVKSVATPREQQSDAAVLTLEPEEQQCDEQEAIFIRKQEMLKKNIHESKTETHEPTRCDSVKGS